jgi:Flp pilus assembly protein TadD
MKSTANRTRAIGLAATTAIAAALLTGCATSNAAPAHLSASRAEAALAAGKHDRAITHAEAAVLAEPHNAAYRAVLGSAYLDAGRFASAATSFDDAMKLGDNRRAPR